MESKGRNEEERENVRVDEQPKLNHPRCNSYYKKRRRDLPRWIDTYLGNVLGNLWRK